MSDQTVQLTTPLWLDIHWNMCCVIISFTFPFGMYVVWVKSPKEMAQYRHFLSCIVLYTSFFDLLLCCFVRPIVLFPMWGGFSNSPVTAVLSRGMSAVGLLDGDFTYFMPGFLFMLNVTLLSLVFGFLFRYWALQTQPWILKTATRFWRVNTAIIFAIGGPGPTFCALSRTSRKSMIDYVRSDFPQYAGIINSTKNWVVYDSGAKEGTIWIRLFGCSCIVTDAVIFTIGAVTVRLIISDLNKLKAHMSEKTYKLHRNLLISLCWQAAIPIVIYFIPIIIAITFMGLGVRGNVQEWMHVLTALMGSHSSINVVLMTYFTKPYREFAIEQLRKIFKFKPKVIPENHLSNNNTSSGLV